MTRREIIREASRHRRVLRGREVHRHAGEALLERHVRAARVLGRRPPRAGDPARRRGAGRRRRGVPAPLPRADGGARRATGAPCCSSRTTCRCWRRLCDRAILLREGSVVQDGPSEQVVAHYLQAEGGAGSRRFWPDLATAPGGKRVRIREIRVVDEQGHLVDSVDIRRPVGIEISFTLLRDDVAVFPKIKVIDREGNNAFNDGRPEPASGASRRRPATTWPRPGSPATSSTRVCTRSSRASRASARSAPNKLVHQARVPEAVAFHVHDPGRGDTSKGGFAGQFRGAVRPLLEWTTERR